MKKSKLISILVLAFAMMFGAVGGATPLAAEEPVVENTTQTYIEEELPSEEGETTAAEESALPSGALPEEEQLSEEQPAEQQTAPEELPVEEEQPSEEALPEEEIQTEEMDLTLLMEDLAEEEVIEVAEEEIEESKLMASPSGGGWGSASSTTAKLPSSYVRAFNSNEIRPVNYSNNQPIVWGSTKYADAPKIKFPNGIVIPDGDTYDLVLDVYKDSLNPSTDVWFGTGINEKNVLTGDVSDVYKVAPTVGIAYTGPSDASHGNKRQNQVGAGEFEYRWYLEKNGKKVTDVPFVAGSRWISHNATHYDEYANIKTSGTIYTNGSWMSGSGMSGFSGTDFIYVMGASTNGEVIGYYTSSERSLVEGSYATNEQEIMFPKVNVYYKSDANGTITGKTSESRIVTQKPTGSTDKPKSNYEFTNWTVDKKVTLTDGTVIKAGGVITDAQIKMIRLIEDVTLTAHHITYHKITTSIDNGGTITPQINDIPDGENRTITWKPATNYYVVSVTVDGTPVKNPNEAGGEQAFKNITADHDVVVKTLPYHKITTEVVNGTIDTQITKIKSGENKSVKYSPNSGYILDLIEVDGEKKDITNPSTLDKYPFDNVQKDHHIKVVYVKPEAPVKKVLDASGKDINKNYVATGSELHYEITFKNNTSAERTYTVSDVVPDGSEYVSAQDGGKIEGNTVIWKGIKLQPNEEKTVHWIAKASRDKAAIKNKAELTIKSASGDVKLPTNEVENWTPTKPIKDVFDSKNVEYNKQMVKAGDTLVYVITVENNASVEKTGTITDTLPKGVEFVSANDNGKHSNGIVTWTLPFKGNETKELSITVKVLDSAKDTVLVNVGEAKFDDIANPTNSVENPVIPDPVKKVQDSQGRDLNGKLIPEGQELYYSITFKNPANEAKDYRIEDLLPAYTEFVRVGDNGSFDSKTKMLTWNVNVPAHKEATVSFVAKAVGKNVYIPNSATVYVEKISMKTNTVENWVYVNPVKSVLDSSNKDMNGKTVKAGDVLTYTITASNPYNIAKDMTITDSLPAGTEFVSADNNGKLNNGVVTWTLKVDAGKEVTVSFKVKVANNANSNIKNSATAKIENAELPTNQVENPLQGGSNSNKQSTPKTADDFNAVTWMSLLFGAIVLGAFSMKRMKRDA